MCASVNANAMCYVYLTSMWVDHYYAFALAHTFSHRLSSGMCENKSGTHLIELYTVFSFVRIAFVFFWCFRYIFQLCPKFTASAEITWHCSITMNKVDQKKISEMFGKMAVLNGLGKFSKPQHFDYFYILIFRGRWKEQLSEFQILK